MSRSGYSDDHEGWASICWRGAVNSALKGARGQAFLKEALVALDALEPKALIAESLSVNGGVCTLGAVGAARGIDMAPLEGYEGRDNSRVAARAFDIAPAMAAEIMFHNDEGNYRDETDEQRYTRMHKWIVAQIKEPNEQT